MKNFEECIIEYAKYAEYIEENNYDYLNHWKNKNTIVDKMFDLTKAQPDINDKLLSKAVQMNSHFLLHFLRPLFTPYTLHKDIYIEMVDSGTVTSTKKLILGNSCTILSDAALRSDIKINGSFSEYSLISPSNYDTAMFLVNTWDYDIMKDARKYIFNYLDYEIVELHIDVRKEKGWLYRSIHGKLNSIIEDKNYHIPLSLVNNKEKCKGKGKGKGKGKQNDNEYSSTELRNYVNNYLGEYSKGYSKGHNKGNSKGKELIKYIIEALYELDNNV